MTIPSIVNGAAESLSVSGTAAVTGTPLEVGVYAMWATVDTYIKLNESSAVASGVTTATGYKILAAGEPVGVRVTEPAFLAGIAGSAGTLYYHKV